MSETDRIYWTADSNNGYTIWVDDEPIYSTHDKKEAAMFELEIKKKIRDGVI